MKTPSPSGVLVRAVLLSVGLAVGYAQAAEDQTKEVVAALRGYFKALGERDIAGLQAVTDTRLALITATDQNATVHILETNNEKAVFPPAGNKDWEQTSLESLRTEISATHPSIATISFTLSLPLDAKTVSAHRAILKKPPPDLTAEQKKRIEKRIADRAINNSMFAVLARREGKWRVITLSVPH
jgi:hypothetical protein